MPYSCDFRKKSTIAYLRDCLKLQNNIACLNVLIDNILEVGKRHLDPVIPASLQRRTLKTIKEELKELYPDVFLDEDSEKRLYIAVQIITRDHRSKRQDLRKKVGQLPHQEQAGTPASKPVSKKHRTRQNSDEKHINQTLVDATQHATDKPYDKRRRIPDVRHSPLASAPGCNQQDENQAPMQITMHGTAKASDTRSANIIPHTERPPSTPMQVSDKQDEDPAPMLLKTIKILNIRRSPPPSMQGFDEHDEDHVPLDVAMHEADTVSDKKIHGIRRSLPTPSQGFDKQHENQVPMDVRTHATDKASGKMRTKEVFDSRRSSLVPIHEKDEDQAPMNRTMHTMDQIPDRRKAKMPRSKRMALSLTSIVNMPPAPNMFGSPSLRVHASQPSVGVPTPFSQPRGRVLFAPHISKSQSQADKTLSQPIDDPCSNYPSISTPHPVTHLTSANVSSDPSTSKDSPEDSPMHGSAVSRGDEFISVHHFLEACVPSMSHLLPRFVDFGCTHEGFLFAVSMWPPEKIKKFLEDVVTSPNGQLITPMEKMVLENHLTRYFKA